MSQRMQTSEPDKQGGGSGAETMFPPEFVRTLTQTLEAGEAEAVYQALEGVAPPDLADLLEILAPADRTALLELLGNRLDPEVLGELEEGFREDVVEDAEPALVARAMRDLDSDDALALIENLPPEAQKRILMRAPPSKRAAIERALDYPEESAGRLMQRGLVAVPTFWSVGDAIDYLRGSDDLPNDFTEIYVVDPAFRPAGSLPLSHVMRAGRDKKLADLMNPKPHIIPAEMDQEQAAYRFRQYNLVSAPVADAQGRLVGMITADDIFDVMAEEAGEDIQALGGVAGETLSDSAPQAARRRFIWLAINLLTAILASSVIALFGGTIEQMVALAILMPIIASMGGVAGIQTLTIAVRALATEDLVPANRGRIIRRELTIGILNGLLLALLMAMIGIIWFGSPALGGILFAAIIINMVIAALAGILIPLGLKRVGVDPAIASGVFLTTITDVVGFFAFLGLAAWLLL